MGALKAFAVLEEDENTGGIIFAKHAVTARRIGANEYAGGEFGYVRCHRAPWADQFAGTGIVPASVMVENGWHFECASCGRQIDSDLAWLYDDGIEEPDTTDTALRYKGWTPDHVIGSQNSLVYCNRQCKDENDAYEAKRKRIQDRAIRLYERHILRRFPDAEIVRGDDRYMRPHAYATKHKGRWRLTQVAVSFNFPGMKYGPACLLRDERYDKREPAAFTCCGGDREVFEAYAATPQPTGGR